MSHVTSMVILYHGAIKRTKLQPGLILKRLESIELWSESVEPCNSLLPAKLYDTILNKLISILHIAKGPVINFSVYTNTGYISL